MIPFVYHNPTRLIFGKGMVEKLPEQVTQYGKRVLLVYGGGSIKRNGVYDQVMEQLNRAGAEVLELSGVEPNPRLTTVHRGVQLCKEEGVELVLAVGGGSVIDCAKAIAVGAKYEGDAWDIVTRKVTPKDALPIGTVLTHAATGSEMNGSSVITNWETKEKLGWGGPLAYPKFSILDPTYTITAPKDHTIYGIVDIMSHVFEQYISHTENRKLQAGIAEAILRTVIETAPKLLENLESYDHRETIMYCGTMALNGTLAMGVRTDWATHQLEHAVSAVYDIPHGGGLAILFPNWMEHVLDEGVGMFKQMAVNVFGVDPSGKSDRDTALEGIRALREFWTSIGAPSRLADYGIGDEQLEVMAEKAMTKGTPGHFKPLMREDIIAIYRKSL